jgi:DNA-binding response OmpR family regulator
MFASTAPFLFCTELLASAAVFISAVNGDTGRVAAVEQGLDLPTILLVEDDQTIRDMVEEALVEGGSQVVIARLPRKPWREARTSGTRYRYQLGGKIDGWGVARIAREIDPAFPVVYMPGSAAEEWPSKGVPQSILLTKPFAPAQLLTAVAQLINAGTQTTTAS